RQASPRREIRLDPYGSRCAGGPGHWASRAEHASASVDAALRFRSTTLGVFSLDRKREPRMNKLRIFLGSAGKQAALLESIMHGLEDVADVEPWMTTFNPGRSTLDRLVELSHEVDFAAFVFAQDDWTSTDVSQDGQASPRDNVVFEAGLFGGT